MQVEGVEGAVLVVGADHEAARAVVEDDGSGAVVLVGAGGAALVGAEDIKCNGVEGHDGAVVGAVVAAVVLACGDGQDGAVGAEGGGVPDARAAAVGGDEGLAGGGGAVVDVDGAHLTAHRGVVGAGGQTQVDLVVGEERGGPGPCGGAEV